MSANSQTISESAPKPVSRREFLYYLGGASLALFSTSTCAVVYQFAQVSSIPAGPGIIELDLDLLQLGLPIFLREYWTYLNGNDEKLIAFSRECPFDKIRVVWVDVTNRFECPGCGSKFRSDGIWISGPATDGMDRFILHVETPRGILHTPEDGSAVPIDEATRVWVDTRTKIPGQPRE